MGREVWGTYSVRDHLQPRAFVADVMLYDRLVLPVPPSEPDNERDNEWARWRREGWAPESQAEIIAALGPLAYSVPWGSVQRAQWEKMRIAAQIAGESTSPYQVTGGVLARGLPAHVTGVTAVATYASKALLEKDLGIKSVEKSGGLPGSTLCAVLGREFLLPDPEEHPGWADLDLLKQAVDLSGDHDFRRKRASFWRWQREFVADGVTDPQAIEAAVEEMQDLLEEEKAAVRKRKIKTVSLFAFCIASLTLGVVGAPLTPVALGGAFLSVGQFSAERFFERGQQGEPSAAALFFDANRHLGWG